MLIEFHQNSLQKIDHLKRGDLDSEMYSDIYMGLPCSPTFFYYYLVTTSTCTLKIFATFRIVSICLPVAAAK